MFFGIGRGVRWFCFRPLPPSKGSATRQRQKVPGDPVRRGRGVRPRHPHGGGRGVLGGNLAACARGATRADGRRERYRVRLFLFCLSLRHILPHVIVGMPMLISHVGVDLSILLVVDLSMLHVVVDLSISHMISCGRYLPISEY